MLSVTSAFPPSYEAGRSVYIEAGAGTARARPCCLGVMVRFPPGTEPSHPRALIPALWAGRDRCAEVNRLTDGYRPEGTCCARLHWASLCARVGRRDPAKILACDKQTRRVQAAARRLVDGEPSKQRDPVRSCSAFGARVWITWDLMRSTTDVAPRSVAATLELPSCSTAGATDPSSERLHRARPSFTGDARGPRRWR